MYGFHCEDSALCALRHNLSTDILVLKIPYHSHDQDGEASSGGSPPNREEVL